MSGRFFKRFIPNFGLNMDNGLEGALRCVCNLVIVRIEEMHRYQVARFSGITRRPPVVDGIRPKVSDRVSSLVLDKCF